MTAPAKDRDYAGFTGGLPAALPDRPVPGTDRTVADLMRQVAAIRLARWGVHPEIAQMLNVDGEA